MMGCAGPEEIQDWELEAYADGESLPHVAEHLKRCSACRMRLADYIAFEHRLCRALYRFNCPTTDTLRDYYWGYLPADEHQQVALHLKTCPHCAAELEYLDEFVATERAHPLSILLARARQAAEQARLIVARLLSPVPRPVPVLRGEIREVLLFDAEGIELALNLEQEETGGYTIFGQVLLPEKASLSQGYVRLGAHREDMDPIQAPLDANGGFALTNLNPGTYHLTICLPQKRIVVPILALKTEP